MGVCRDRSFWYTPDEFVRARRRARARRRVRRCDSKNQIFIPRRTTRTRTRTHVKPDGGAIRRARDGDDVASTDVARVFRRDAIGRRVRGVRGWDDDACAMCVRKPYG